MQKACSHRIPTHPFLCRGLLFLPSSLEKAGEATAWRRDPPLTINSFLPARFRLAPSPCRALKARRAGNLPPSHHAARGAEHRQQGPGALVHENTCTVKAEKTHARLVPRFPAAKLQPGPREAAC